MSMDRTFNPNVISSGLISRVRSLNSSYPCQNVVLKVELIGKKIEIIMQCKHFALQSGIVPNVLAIMSDVSWNRL